MRRPGAISSLGALVVFTGVAWAGFTSPTLVVSAASAARLDTRLVVAIDGAFDFPNAVQVGYPVSLLVFQGTTFVRFPAAGAPVTGTSPLLADGILTEAEYDVLVGQGAPTGADVRLVTMTPGTLRATLPSTFTAGSATAMLYAIVEDGTVPSNALPFSLP